ncbi:MAG: hypothetical protein PQ612_06090 [Rickettsiales bacterium]|nr:hypothetical protein [Pseudomonadota bacterium]MDA0966894.1 hypothetical protein [Pseudomonadota bacterium]MDG4543569.1 hypothetical protein [Rickettsiales bacterium]MDG4545717.1 hypothetical protein [Rickettsiales bacterium]MDG4547510.1 hypothetical protein [Rickettsiales bacterium]
MSDEPTNAQLHILMTEVKGDMKLVLSKLDEINKWRDNHEKSDKSEHNAIHKRISDMRSTMSHIAIVSIVIGFVAGAFSKLKNIILGG